MHTAGDTRDARNRRSVQVEISRVTLGPGTAAPNCLASSKCSDDNDEGQPSSPRGVSMFLSSVLTVLVLVAPVNQPQPGVPAEYLTSNLFSPGIPLPESDRPIHEVQLYLKTFQRGKGG